MFCVWPLTAFVDETPLMDSPIGWDCRIHWLQKYEVKAPVMLGLLGMWNIPLLQPLPGHLWPGVEAPDRVLSMGKIELFDI